MSWNDLRRGRVSEPGREYLVTCVTHQRQPFFRDFLLAREMIRVMRRLQEEQQLEWLTWVLMPDHLHGLVRLEQGRLSETMQLLKGRSARRINLHLHRKGKVWQANFHDHALRQEEDRLAMARYIVLNPLRAGLVSSIGAYPHWDSVWLK